MIARRTKKALAKDGGEEGSHEQGTKNL